MKLHYTHILEAPMLNKKYQLDVYIPKDYNPYRIIPYSTVYLFDNEIDFSFEESVEFLNNKKLVLIVIKITDDITKTKNIMTNPYQFADYLIKNEFDGTDKVFGIASQQLVFLKRHLIDLINENYHVQNNFTSRTIIGAGEIAGMLLVSGLRNLKLADKLILKNPIVIGELVKYNENEKNIDLFIEENIMMPSNILEILLHYPQEKIHYFDELNQFIEQQFITNTINKSE